jgi:hypothetical protein
VEKIAGVTPTPADQEPEEIEGDSVAAESEKPATRTSKREAHGHA